jgi:hypothetical protein
MKLYKPLLSVIFLLALSLTALAQHDHSSMGSNSSSSSSSNSNMNMNMNMNSHVTMIPPKTETLKVWGKCNMCKARIEKIAMEGGATTADWNVKSKFLTIVYDPDKSNMNYISDKLAKAGHDTGLRSAKDKAYNKLPDCCKYERSR